MEIYTFRTGVISVESPDLTGFDVEAQDGHIGKIDEASYENSSSCLVVDTGFWIFGKRRMIPAALVRDVDWEAKKVTVGLTKDQVKSAPDFDDEAHRKDENAYHRNMGEYYRPFGT